MDKCREAFEKTRTFKEFDARSPVVFSNFGGYVSVEDGRPQVYLNGALSSYQEQQKRIEDLERKLQIKTRHCQFYEQSRKGHRSLAIARKKQINSALGQIEKLYSKAEGDYKKECDSYYDGMLSGLDLAEQAIRGELEEQALKGGEV